MGGNGWGQEAKYSIQCTDFVGTGTHVWIVEIVFSFNCRSTGPRHQNEPALAFPNCSLRHFNSRAYLGAPMMTTDGIDGLTK